MEMHRRTLEIATDLIERTDAGDKQLVTLLTAEVGHTESTVVYEENKLELHRYSPAESEHETPIFIVYALVNRPYILDLQPDRSVVRQFLAAGFEVYLVSWGEPSRLDRSLGLRDYVCRYIHNCVDVIRERSDVEAVHLLGYCMGGTMALMYTSRFQERVRTLGLMATPFAFDGAGGLLEHWANHYSADVVVERLGNIPAELLAVGFSMMDPVDQYLTKYVRLFENIQDEAFVANFSRMEQWIWDGVDVPGAVYREFLDDIYTDNKLARSEFELDGERVDLSTIEVPVLQIVGEYDHIVPPESSKPFSETVASEDERIIEFPAGHIGISVSSKAHRELWPDVCDWFADRDGPVSGGEQTTPDAGPAVDE
jgi:polyhydroxyalkanoate synthase